MRGGRDKQRRAAQHSVRHTNMAQSKDDDHECEHPHHAPVPLPRSGRDFFEAFSNDASLFDFIIDIVLRSDFMRHVAGETLKEIAPDHKGEPKKEAEWKKLTPQDLAMTKPGPATIFLRRRRLALLQMNLCRIADNFTTFLASIIREALAARPEMLRSNEQIRLDYALSFASVDDLREDLIDRKVADLGYLGFAALLDWINDHMGITVITEEHVRNEIIELLETRNAIVHNRGVIGEKYLRTVIAPKFKEGELRSIEVEDYARCCETIATSVKEIDVAISRKFGLKTELYPGEKSEGGA